MFDLNQLADAPLKISEIRCEAKIWEVRRNHRRGGLMTFRGIYLPGSAGVDDARFIRWKLEEFYELHRPDALIVDCRELEYVWGDNLHFPDRSRSGQRVSLYWSCFGPSSRRHTATPYRKRISG